MCPLSSFLMSQCWSSIILIIVDDDLTGTAMDMERGHRVDLVHYRVRWEMEGVNAASLEGILGSAKDRAWVMQQCVMHTCASPDAQALLLEYGLRETETFLSPGTSSFFGDAVPSLELISIFLWDILNSSALLKLCMLYP